MFEVVKNDEDQYSVWAADMAMPAGWTAVGQRGSKEQCIAFIRTHWTDMTPASLRRTRQ